MARKAKAKKSDDKNAKVHVVVPPEFQSMLESIEKIKEHPHNVKAGHNIRLIANLLVEHGWHAPIVANEKGQILIGNGRYLAARRLGLEEVPVLRRPDSDREGIRRMVSDNRSSEFSMWDIEELRIFNVYIDDQRDALLLSDLYEMPIIDHEVDIDAEPEPGLEKEGETKESQQGSDDGTDDNPGNEVFLWEMSFDSDNEEALKLVDELDNIDGVVLRKL